MASRAWDSGNTTDFEKHGARTDHGNPGINGALTLTHPGFGRTAGDGLVRENPDPGLTFTLEDSG